jgi:ATP-dependent Clp endopeptidase proteolytic subunit ClpP
MSNKENDVEFESVAELPEPRVIGLYGDVSEENSQEAIISLLHLHYNRDSEITEDGTVISLPIEFYVSTGGGLVAEMFAIYDLMRMVREDCAIQTFGIGKVMSAGVLLLAAGTKGERRIGKNCRIMLHRVLTGDSGSLHSIQATYKEAEIVEGMMFKALAQETNLTVPRLKKIVSKNLDAFFSAEEAVEMGIADIIV